MTISTQKFQANQAQSMRMGWCWSICADERGSRESLSVAGSIPSFALVASVGAVDAGTAYQPKRHLTNPRRPHRDQ